MAYPAIQELNSTPPMNSQILKDHLDLVLTEARNAGLGEWLEDEFGIGNSRDRKEEIRTLVKQARGVGLADWLDDKFGVPRKQPEVGKAGPTKEELRARMKNDMVDMHSKGELKEAVAELTAGQADAPKKEKKKEGLRGRMKAELIDMHTNGELTSAVAGATAGQTPGRAAAPGAKTMLKGKMVSSMPSLFTRQVQAQPAAKPKAANKGEMLRNRMKGQLLDMNETGELKEVAESLSKRTLPTGWYELDDGDLFRLLKEDRLGLLKKRAREVEVDASQLEELDNSADPKAEAIRLIMDTVRVQRAMPAGEAAQLPAYIDPAMKRLLGIWFYGSSKTASGTYSISQIGRTYHFQERLQDGRHISGVFTSVDVWQQARLTIDDGTSYGTLRIRYSEDLKGIVSNFQHGLLGNWDADVNASKVLQDDQPSLDEPRFDETVLRKASTIFDGTWNAVITPSCTLQDAWSIKLPLASYSPATSSLKHTVCEAFFMQNELRCQVHVVDDTKVGATNSLSSYWYDITFKPRPGIPNVLDCVQVASINGQKRTDTFFLRRSAKQRWLTSKDSYVDDLMAWLTSMGLDSYAGRFHQHGYDRLEVLTNLSKNEEDVDELVRDLGISAREAFVLKDSMAKLAGRPSQSQQKRIEVTDDPLMNRLHTRLAEHQLSVRDFPESDDELTTMLKELGFSALESAKMRKKLKL